MGVVVVVKCLNKLREKEVEGRRMEGLDATPKHLKEHNNKKSKANLKLSGIRCDEFISLLPSESSKNQPTDPLSIFLSFPNFF